jgi:hypothetical protein
MRNAMSETPQQQEPLASISQTGILVRKSLEIPDRHGHISFPARIVGRTISSLIIVGAIVIGIYVSHLYYAFPRTDDAYVRSNIVGIAPHLSGPITELPVQDN